MDVELPWACYGLLRLVLRLKPSKSPGFTGFVTLLRLLRPKPAGGKKVPASRRDHQSIQRFTTPSAAFCSLPPVLFTPSAGFSGCRGSPRHQTPTVTCGHLQTPAEALSRFFLFQSLEAWAGPDWSRFPGSGLQIGPDSSHPILTYPDLSGPLKPPSHFWTALVLLC